MFRCAKRPSDASSLRRPAGVRLAGMLAISGAIAMATADRAGNETGALSSRSEESLAASHRDSHGIVRARQPRPLTGVPLRSRTGLRLVVAARRPFVLDVDSGSLTDVRGVPEVRKGVLWVVPVGGRGAAIVARSAADARIYGLSRHDATAVSLGAGRSVAPAAKGDAVWILAVAGRRRCTIRGATLTGRTTLRRRAFRCAATIDAGGRTGIVVNRTVLYDPETSKVLLRASAGIVAAAGTTLVLLTRPGENFTLLDSRTRRQKLLRWPSKLAADRPAADPRGRFVALAFADPSGGGAGKQVLDIWLLNTRTRELTQVPDMPAFVALKYTSMSWTNDGRLVLLARSMGRDLVAVWRPGQRRLAIRTVRLRPRTSGSDSFATIG
jgi:hypothetical protein